MNQDLVPTYVIEAFHDVKTWGGCSVHDTKYTVSKMQELKHDAAVEWLLSDESPTGVDLGRYWALIVCDGGV